MHDISDDTLVRIIRDYWQSRGYKVNVAVGDCKFIGKVQQVITYRAIRSDLLNAMPRGYRGELGVKG